MDSDTNKQSYATLRHKRIERIGLEETNRFSSASSSDDEYGNASAVKDVDTLFVKKISPSRPPLLRAVSDGTMETESEQVSLKKSYSKETLESKDPKLFKDSERKQLSKRIAAKRIANDQINRLLQSDTLCPTQKDEFTTETIEALKRMKKIGKQFSELSHEKVTQDYLKGIVSELMQLKSKFPKSNNPVTTFLFVISPFIRQASTYAPTMLSPTTTHEENKSVQYSLNPLSPTNLNLGPLSPSSPIQNKTGGYDIEHAFENFHGHWGNLQQSFTERKRATSTIDNTLVNKPYVGLIFDDSPVTKSLDRGNVLNDKDGFISLIHTPPIAERSVSTPLRLENNEKESLEKILGIQNQPASKWKSTPQILETHVKPKPLRPMELEIPDVTCTTVHSHGESPCSLPVSPRLTTVHEHSTQKEQETQIDLRRSIMGEGSQMLCRICEEKVSADLIEEHVAACLDEYRQFYSEQRLKRIQHSLSKLCESTYDVLGVDDDCIIPSSPLNPTEIPSFETILVQKLGVLRNVERAVCEIAGLWVEGDQSTKMKKNVPPPPPTTVPKNKPSSGFALETPAMNASTDVVVDRYARYDKKKLQEKSKRLSSDEEEITTQTAPPLPPPIPCPSPTGIGSTKNEPEYKIYPSGLKVIACDKPKVPRDTLNRVLVELHHLSNWLHEPASTFHNKSTYITIEDNVITIHKDDLQTEEKKDTQDVSGDSKANDHASLITDDMIKAEYADITSITTLVHDALDILTSKVEMIRKFVNHSIDEGKPGQFRHILTRITSFRGTKQFSEPRINDFELLKPISRGAYGRVFLAAKKRTGDLYAIKILDKAEMLRKNQIAHIMAERNVMAKANCPYVVKLYFSFQTKHRLFLVMEFVHGGDLLSLLTNCGSLSEDVVKQYAAEIVVALKYLHEKLGVCHRDLKPDNILLDKHGHIKLTDFGLSPLGVVDDLNLSASTNNPLNSLRPIETDDGQEVPYSVRRKKSDTYAVRKKTLHSRVGTPDYMAPEILLGTGHTVTCDWWSLGVIIYELFVGFPPFNDESPELIFKNIMEENITPIPEDVEISGEAVELISGMLIMDPLERLGSQGAKEVQQADFFAGIDFERLERGDFVDQDAPFVPELQSEIDLSYFGEKNVEDMDILQDNLLESPRSNSPLSQNEVESVADVIVADSPTSDNSTKFDYEVGIGPYQPKKPSTSPTYKTPSPKIAHKTRVQGLIDSETAPKLIFSDDDECFHDNQRPISRRIRHVHSDANIADNLTSQGNYTDPQKNRRARRAELGLGDRSGSPLERHRRRSLKSKNSGNSDIFQGFNFNFSNLDHLQEINMIKMKDISHSRTPSGTSVGSHSTAFSVQSDVGRMHQHFSDAPKYTTDEEEET